MSQYICIDTGKIHHTFYYNGFDSAFYLAGEWTILFRSRQQIYSLHKFFRRAALYKGGAKNV